jgi:hypothetical protein
MTPLRQFPPRLPRQFWRESGPLARVAAVAALLAWPFVLPALIGFFTQRNGSAVRARTGKGIARQVWEQVTVMATHAILPPWYYIFELHDDGKRRRAGEYLHRFETKRFAYEFLRRTNGGAPVPAARSTEALSNKALFSERCRDYQLPAVPVLMVLSDGEIVACDTGAAAADRPFIKLIHGTGGRGAERWDYLAGLGDARGHALTAPALVARLQAATLSARKGYIVQPRLEHRDIRDPRNGAFTVRVMTCRNEGGDTRSPTPPSAWPRATTPWSTTSTPAASSPSRPPPACAVAPPWRARLGPHRLVRAPSDTGGQILGRRPPLGRRCSTSPRATTRPSLTMSSSATSPSSRTACA